MSYNEARFFTDSSDYNFSFRPDGNRIITIFFAKGIPREVCKWFLMLISSVYSCPPLAEFLFLAGWNSEKN